MGDDLTQHAPAPGREKAAHAPPAGPVLLEQDFDAGSLYLLRAAVSAHGAEAGLTRSRLYDVVTVAHELAANAVRHGAGRGRLRLWVDGGLLRCQVTDAGRAPAAGAPAPGGQAEEASGGQAEEASGGQAGEASGAAGPAGQASGGQVTEAGGGPADDAAGEQAGEASATRAGEAGAGPRGDASGDGPAAFADGDQLPWREQHGHGLWVVSRVADQFRIDRAGAATTATADFLLDGTS